MPINVSNLQKPEPQSFRPGTTGIANTLYSHFERSTSDRVQRAVYASGLTECARMQGFSLMGFKRATTSLQAAHPEWAVVAEVGNRLHEMILSALEELGVLVEDEFTVRSEDGTLVGRVDGRLKLADGRELLLDIKTVKGADFKKGSSAPKFNTYRAQLSVYCRILGLTDAVVLLVNRDSGEWDEYEFTVDPAYADSLLARAASIYRLATARVVDEPEVWGSFFCTAFCPFYRQCAAQNADGSVQADLDAGLVAEDI